MLSFVHVFQIRLKDDLFDEVRRIAKEQEATMADVVRQSIDFYAISTMFARDGRRLLWEDPVTKARTDVMIPGLTLHKRIP